MVIRFQKQSGNPFTKNVSFMFVVYWGILVLWQNIGIAETRGMFDLVIKMGLLAYFTSFYLLRVKTLNLKGLLVVLLAMSLLFTAGSESSFPLSNVIAYVYPVLVLLLVYGLGDKFEINRSHLVAFCNCVIGITAYAAIYAMLFCWDQFAGAFTIDNAYGNELSSFFISNHEYGMYLVASIISAIVCMRLTPKLSKWKKYLYITAIILFSANLLLTFSRTSMLGLAVFLLTCCFFELPKFKKWIIGALIVIVAAVILIKPLQEFVYEIVLKENNDAGRNDLFEYGVQYFQNGSLYQKIFGHGIIAPRTYFERYHEHGSVHNGYLQILLYYGLVVFVAMVLFTLYQIFNGIRFIKVDRFAGTLSLGLMLAATAMMITNTAIIFTSSIDSFFLTMFFVVVPKYIRISTQNGTFLNC